MEKQPIIIFGTGGIAQLANFYFETDSAFEVVAFTVDKEFITNSLFEGKPVVSFDHVHEKYPPRLYKMFVALSYVSLNKIRQAKFLEAKRKGYELVSYISSRSHYMTHLECGENCFILEGSDIQPFVKIGNNVTIWSNACVGHHSIIEDHNFIGAESVISGFCHIESNCFIGANATIGHQVIIACENILGAGSITLLNTEKYSVYLPPRSIKIEKKSSEIMI